MAPFGQEVFKSVQSALLLPARRVVAHCIELWRCQCFYQMSGEGLGAGILLGVFFFLWEGAKITASKITFEFSFIWSHSLPRLGSPLKTNPLAAPISQHTYEQRSALPPPLYPALLPPVHACMAWLPGQKLLFPLCLYRDTYWHGFFSAGSMLLFYLYKVTKETPGRKSQL